MGWASAGAIFDPIATALVDLDASAEVKRRVLGTLIRTLCDGDWDTTDESLDQFRDDPVIVSLFYQHDSARELTYGDVDTAIDYDHESDEWLIECKGRSGHGVIARAECTAEAHNRLVLAAVGHDRDLHGGSGDVEPYWLMAVASNA